MSEIFSAFKVLDHKIKMTKFCLEFFIGVTPQLTSIKFPCEKIVLLLNIILNVLICQYKILNLSENS